MTTFRWKRDILISLALLVLLLACFSAKFARALPPPVVSLEFLNFNLEGTNVVAVLSFTNLGQNEVCLWESAELWELVAKTPSGWFTNRADFASVTGDPVLPRSNKLFTVPIPLGTTEWQVRTTYGFHKKRHASTEFYSWAWSSWLVQQSPQPVANSISWCLDLLPKRPFPSLGEVCTPIITNLPPQL